MRYRLGLGLGSKPKAHDVLALTTKAVTPTRRECVNANELDEEQSLLEILLEHDLTEPVDLPRVATIHVVAVE